MFQNNFPGNLHGAAVSDVAKKLQMADNETKNSQVSSEHLSPSHACQQMFRYFTIKSLENLVCEIKTWSRDNSTLVH